MKIICLWRCIAFCGTFFACDDCKWGGDWFCFEFLFEFVVKVFSCIRIVKNTSQTSDNVELGHRAVLICYFMWLYTHYFAYGYRLFVWLCNVPAQGSQHHLACDPV